MSFSHKKTLVDTSQAIHKLISSQLPVERASTPSRPTCRPSLSITLPKSYIYLHWTKGLRLLVLGLIGHTKEIATRVPTWERAFLWSF